jgi:hypothetical protein
MHRRRTKLVERTTRLTERIGTGSRLVGKAEALTHRGVITTYKLHDRALDNRRARHLLDEHPSRLTAVQERVLGELERQDYAVVAFSDLVSEPALKEISDDAGGFAAGAGRAGARDEHKDYLVRRYARGETIAVDSPWLAACLSPSLLDLANAYLHMWSKLEYVDFWYSVPLPADSERIQSQRWHRDFDDRHLLKAFLYLVDVDEGTGPFEFVAGSARGGALAAFYPWYPLSPADPSHAEFDRAVNPEEVRTFTAPAGTLVLCNTSGFHRGGFATAKPRVLATATYCSPASLKSLTERNYRLPSGYAHSLGAPQRYAVA